MQIVANSIDSEFESPASRFCCCALLCGAIGCIARPSLALLLMALWKPRQRPIGRADASWLRLQADAGPAMTEPVLLEAATRLRDSRLWALQQEYARTEAWREDPSFATSNAKSAGPELLVGAVSSKVFSKGSFKELPPSGIWCGLVQVAICIQLENSEQPSAVKST